MSLSVYLFFYSDPCLLSYVLIRNKKSSSTALGNWRVITKTLYLVHCQTGKLNLQGLGLTLTKCDDQKAPASSLGRLPRLHHGYTYQVWISYKADSHFLSSHSLRVFNFHLTLLNPCISNNNYFYFYSSLCCLTFWETIKCKNKNLRWFSLFVQDRDGRLKLTCWSCWLVITYLEHYTSLDCIIWKILTA